MSKIRAVSALWVPFRDNKSSVYASSACFFLLISAAPGCVLLLMLLPYLPFSQAHWQVLISQMLPEPFLPWVIGFLEEVFQKQSFSVLSISAITTLWSASKGIMSIKDGLHAVLDLPRNTGFFRRSLISISYFLLIMFSLFLTVFIIVFGDKVLIALAGDRLSTDFVFRFRRSIAFTLLTVLFAIIYRVLPLKVLPWKECIISSMLVSAGWLMLSYGFSIYIRFFSNSEQFYGSIGSLLLAAIWLRLCVIMLLYGAVLAKLRRDDAYHPLKIIKRIFRYK